MTYWTGTAGFAAVSLSDLRVEKWIPVGGRDGVGALPPSRPIPQVAELDLFREHLRAPEQP